jgi:ATP-dependent Clp protease ATP-binding subunit ClpA
MEAIKKMFTPEFRNRLDAIVQFGSLTLATIKTVVDKFVMELQTQLDDKHVTLEISEDAREWLAIHGYDVQMGARPMARLIQEKLKKPLAEAILFGELSHGGGTVEVDLDPINDQLEIEITAKQQPAVQTAKV